jgi:hypothetical protein
MVKAIDIDAVSEYICKEDRELPEEEQTRWKLGVIDSLSLVKIDRCDVEFDPDSNEAKVTADILGREMEYVRYGLKGWDNFKDKNGQEIKPRLNTLSKGGRIAEVLHDDCLRRIPKKIIVELAQVLRGETELSGAERKN